MLVRLPQPLMQRQTEPSAAAPSIANAEAPWPSRPDPGVLNGSVPLFFISPDRDGFWIACESDFHIGGIFLFRRSAMRFAQRHSAPNRCATMILAEPHRLTIENEGNRLIEVLRPSLRQAKRVVAKIRSWAAQMSRARLEERLLHAALETELYRGRYRHSNKNDDDLPMVTDIHALEQAAGKGPVTSGIKGTVPVIIAFAIFALILTAIVALKAAIWLPRFPQ